MARRTTAISIDCRAGCCSSTYSWSLSSHLQRFPSRLNLLSLSASTSARDTAQALCTSCAASRRAGEQASINSSCCWSLQFGDALLAAALPLQRSLRLTSRRTRLDDASCAESRHRLLPAVPRLVTSHACVTASKLHDPTRLSPGLLYRRLAPNVCSGFGFQRAVCSVTT